MSKEERDNMQWLSLTPSSRAPSLTQLPGLCPGARSCPPQAQVKPTQIWLRNVHVKSQAWWGLGSEEVAWGYEENDVGKEKDTARERSSV